MYVRGPDHLGGYGAGEAIGEGARVARVVPGLAENLIVRELLEVRLDHVALIRIELNQKPLVHPIDVGIDVSTLVEPAPIVRGCADLFRGELLQEGPGDR